MKLVRLAPLTVSARPLSAAFGLIGSAGPLAAPYTTTCPRVRSGFEIAGERRLADRVKIRSAPLPPVIFLTSSAKFVLV